MPRNDSLTPRDLADKGLHVLRVECSKCGRSGRYRVTTLAKTIGPHGKLTDWLYSLTKDCPRKNSPVYLTPALRGAPTCRRWCNNTAATSRALPRLNRRTTLRAGSSRAAGPDPPLRFPSAPGDRDLASLPQSLTTPDLRCTACNRKARRAGGAGGPSR
jgi:hypothetical protein